MIKRSGLVPKTVRVQRVVHLPLGMGKELDLFNIASEFVGTDFVVRYDPPGPPPGIYIKIGGIAFRVFSNGTVNIFGVFPEKAGDLEREQKVLCLLWNHYLKPFVVEKP